MGCGYPKDRVAVDLVPGAQKSGASAVRIDAVIRIENLHGFAASVSLLAILADKGRPAHEVIGAPGRVFLIVFIHKPVDFPLLLITERGDGFSLFEKAVDQSLGELQLRSCGVHRAATCVLPLFTEPVLTRFFLIPLLFFLLLVLLLC